MQEQGVKVLQTQPNSGLSRPDPKDRRGRTALLSPCSLQPCCKPSNPTLPISQLPRTSKGSPRRQPAIYDGLPLRSTFAEIGRALTRYVRASLLCGNRCAEKRQSPFSDPVALPHAAQGKACVSFIKAYAKAWKGAADHRVWSRL